MRRSSPRPPGETVGCLIGVDGVATEATPSALDRDGDGFAVCAYTTSCPTPAS
ncbi:MAG: hypothetical protein ACYDAQ_17430 [Mycobacteriales bacterium]